MNPSPPSTRAPLPAPAALQAAYYAASGIWPLVAYRSFELITGRKREPWLVKTVGLLTVVIAGSLGADAIRGQPRRAAGLGISSAAAYFAIDTWYAGVRRRISRIYLLDALAEAALIVVWWAHLRGGGRS